MSETPTVFLIEDDCEMRDSLAFLLRSSGLTVRAYSSGTAFLAEYQTDWPGCLVCDMRMPELSGLDVVDRLAAMEALLPVICMTAYADVPMAVRAFKSGVCDFLEKPFSGAQMLDSIRQALAEDSRRRTSAAAFEDIDRRLSSLTPREREALDMILEGLPNKSIAARLGITERAVELRRASLLKKLEASSLAELVQSVTTHRLMAGS